MLHTTLLLACLTPVCALHLEHQDSPPGDRPAPAPIQIHAALALERAGRSGRSPVFRDLVAWHLARGTLAPPVAGGRVAGGEYERTWKEIQAGEKGWFADRSLRGGYLAATVQSPARRVLILAAAGHSTVWINGVPRGGDVYSTGWVHHPVVLERGSNLLLFRVARGRLRAALERPPKEIFFTKVDMTLPDGLIEEDAPLLGAIRVINASEKVFRGTIECAAPGAGKTQSTISDLPPIPPLSSRKVPFLFTLAPALRAAPGKVELRLGLYRRSSAAEREVLDEISIELPVRSAAGLHRRTFRSRIDGSVQYYGVVPPRSAGAGDQRPGLLLTLHGAGVEGLNQARQYAPRENTFIIAPTNRRPYGFDWEDWGRLDALEVLALAQRRFATDPQRTWLSGHSMGGHGTWHLGVNCPDLFAAIAPSAGWISFWSYAGKDKEESDPIQQLVARASSPGDTVALQRNLLGRGVYILHGDRDDNVPVAQARRMRAELGKFHADFCYYERPGAGHWWGAPCCDWPPLMSFLERHTRPAPRDQRTVELHTASPAVTARRAWLTIHAQLHSLAPASAVIAQDLKARSFSGTTTNVAILALDTAQLDPGPSVTLKLDEQELQIPTPAGAKRVWVAKRDGAWMASAPPSPALKGPRRYGPFKEAFQGRMVFVYATAGSADENAWAFAKARYDAETWAYRGNGALDLIPDRDFQPAADRDRNVILYGHQSMNRAWQRLLADSPVQVQRGALIIGDRKLTGDNLACYFVRPRPGSATALVGVVAGTGLEGLRTLWSARYFISGAGYPDLLAIDSSMLLQGWKGVRAAGFFGLDWSVASGDFAWRE